MSQIHLNPLKHESGGREGENPRKANSERRYMLRSKGKGWSGPCFNVHTKKLSGHKQLDGPVDGWMT
jgi:hypothetical protein